MTELSISVDEMLARCPCCDYDRARLIKLARGRERMTAEEILRLRIPPKDRLWAVMHESLLPAPLLHELACQFALAALLAARKAGREPDPRSWAAIEAKRGWLRGELTDKDLRAAADAAWAAVDHATTWADAWTAACAARAAAADATWLSAADAYTYSDADAAQVKMIRAAIAKAKGDQS